MSGEVMAGAPIIEKYSPNTAWGFQSVEIVLMAWNYRAVFVEKVNSNVVGLEVIEEALESLLENFPRDRYGAAEVKLTDDTGCTLLCRDDDGRWMDWLKRMVVSARITAWEPPTLNQIRAMNGAAPVPGGDKPYDPG